MSMSGVGVAFAAIADLPSVSAARGTPRWLSEVPETGRVRAETEPLQKSRPASGSTAGAQDTLMREPDQPRKSMMDNVASFFSGGKKKSSSVAGPEEVSGRKDKSENAPTPSVKFVEEEVQSLKKQGSFQRTMSKGGLVRTASTTPAEMQDKLLAEAQKTAEAPDGGLDSASKVQAKLNMFTAYSEERLQ